MKNTKKRALYIVAALLAALFVLSCLIGFAACGGGDNKCADGHTVTEWTETKEATCTESGSRTGVCDVCGETVTETIPALGHDYVDVVTAPTCGEDGYTTSTCSRCGDSYTTPGAPATGNHTWGEGVVTKAATCTETGVMTYTCTECGAKETSEIPALGHDYQLDTTADGYKAATCGDGTNVYVCSRCGDSYTETVKGDGNHTWGTGTVTKNATKTSDGEIAYTCSVCNESKVETFTNGYLQNFVTGAYDGSNPDEYYYYKDSVSQNDSYFTGSSVDVEFDGSKFIVNGTSAAMTDGQLAAFWGEGADDHEGAEYIVVTIFAGSGESFKIVTDKNSNGYEISGDAADETTGEPDIDKTFFSLFLDVSEKTSDKTLFTIVAGTTSYEVVLGTVVFAGEAEAKTDYTENFVTGAYVEGESVDAYYQYTNKDEPCLTASFTGSVVSSVTLTDGKYVVSGTSAVMDETQLKAFWGSTNYQDYQYDEYIVVTIAAAKGETVTVTSAKNNTYVLDGDAADVDDTFFTVVVDVDQHQTGDVLFTIVVDENTSYQVTLGNVERAHLEAENARVDAPREGDEDFSATFKGEDGQDVTVTFTDCEIDVSYDSSTRTYTIEGVSAKYSAEQLAAMQLDGPDDDHTDCWYVSFKVTANAGETITISTYNGETPENTWTLYGEGVEGTSTTDGAFVLDTTNHTDGDWRMELEVEYSNGDKVTYTIVLGTVQTFCEANGHTWDEGVVTTEPTCTEAGVLTKTCEVCGKTETEEIPALGHTVSEFEDGNMYVVYNSDDSSWYTLCETCEDWFALDEDEYSLSEFILVANSEDSLNAAIDVAGARTDGEVTQILVYGEIEISNESYVKIGCDNVEIYGLGAESSKIVVSSYNTGDGSGNARSGVEITGKNVTIRDLAIDGTTLNGVSTVQYSHAVEIRESAANVALINLVVTGGGNGNEDAPVVVMEAAGNIEITNCTLTGGHNGLTVVNDNDPVTVTISGGTVEGERGIFISGGSKFTLNVDNATVNGKNSLTYNSTVTFTDCTFGYVEKDGTAYGSVNTYTSVTFVNCKFLSHSAGTVNADAIYKDSLNYVIRPRKAEITLTFVDCTFVNINTDIEIGTLDLTKDAFLYVVGSSSVADCYLYFGNPETSLQYVFRAADFTVAHNHDLDDLDDGVVTEPTCTEDGYITYTCAACGETKIEIIPATGHSAAMYSDGNKYAVYMNVAGDEADPDYKWFAYCETCGEWFEIEGVYSNCDLYEFVLVADSEASLNAAISVAGANEDASDTNRTQILVYGTITISCDSYVSIDSDNVEIYGLGAENSAIVVSCHYEGNAIVQSGVEITGENVTIRDLAIDGTALNAGSGSNYDYRHAVAIRDGAANVALINLVVTGGGSGNNDAAVVISTAAGDVTISGCEISGAYNGVEIEHTGANSAVEIAVTISGGTVEGNRGVFISGDTDGNVTLKVDGATVNGMNEFTYSSAVTFSDCTFGYFVDETTAYGSVGTYTDVTFVNCKFLSHSSSTKNADESYKNSLNYVVSPRCEGITLTFVGCTFVNTHTEAEIGTIAVSETTFVYLVGSDGVADCYLWFGDLETSLQYVFHADDFTVEHNHDTGDWVGTVATPATCTADGEMSYTCSVCGVVKTGVPIPATGHAATAYDGTYYAVYDSTGETWRFLCENCGQWIDISTDASFSVYDFDLVASDEASILAALALGKANESSSETERTRIFVCGTVTLSDENFIDIDFDNVEIYGSGAEGSEIVLSTYIGTHSGTAECGVEITGSNVTIRDLTINGDALDISHDGYTYVHAVEVRGSEADNVLLEGLVVTGGGTYNTGSALAPRYFDSSICIMNGTNIRIVDCDLSGASNGLAIEHGTSTLGADITLTVEFSGGSIEGDYRSIWVDGGSGVKLDVENAEINGRNAIGGGIDITFTGCTFGYHTETLLGGILTTVYGSISANGDETFIDCTFLSYDSGNNVDVLYKSSGSGNYTILQNNTGYALTFVDCYFDNTHSDLDEGLTLLTKDNFVYVVGVSCVDVSLYFEEGENALEYLYAKSGHTVEHNHTWTPLGYDYTTGKTSYICKGCGESYVELTGPYVESMVFEAGYKIVTMDEGAFSGLGFTITMSDNSTTYTSIGDYLTRYSGDTVTWTSSDETVATVDGNGNVTLIASGYATIMVEFEITGVTASYILYVGETITDDDPLLGEWAGTESITGNLFGTILTWDVEVSVTVTKEGFTLSVVEESMSVDETIWNSVAWFKTSDGYYILVEDDDGYEIIEIDYDADNNQLSASFEYSFEYEWSSYPITVIVPVQNATLDRVSADGGNTELGDQNP